MPAGVERLRPPFVVTHGDDVRFFGSLSALERHLEAGEVRAGRYVAYDSEGRLLRLGVEPLSGTKKLLGSLRRDVRAEMVVARPAELRPNHSDDLRDVLVGFLVGLGERVDVHASLLSKLVGRAADQGGVMI